MIYCVCDVQCKKIENELLFFALLYKMNKINFI